MGLHRLIYCSRAVSPSRVDLEDILAACARNNPAAHVTGMLLFTGDCFMQVLEGGRGPVSRCFQRIAADARHCDVEVVHAGPADFRLFERWSMRYVPQTGPGAPDFIRFGADDRFDPFAMSAASVEQLCLSASVLAHREEIAIDDGRAAARTRT